VSRAAADLAAAAAASIVQVHGRPRRPSSGIVVAHERVVTTSHSVEREDGVRVRTHDGETLTAAVAGHAPGPDVVLLRVPGLSAAPFDSPRERPDGGAVTPAARPGELVLLAGRAWSGTAHVRLLTVSGVGGPLRAGDGSTIEQVIGLPVSPYPGVSGSAVLGAHGQLVAMATAGIVRGRVLGLPSSALRALVDALEARGTRDRGFLGVTTHAARLAGSQSSAAGQAHGLVVVGIAPDSPAAAALLVGDVIVAADGAVVSSAEDLLDALGPDKVGAPIQLRLVRGGTVADARVTVAARPSRW
jgi:S1-C subfamily serine protease